MNIIIRNDYRAEVILTEDELNGLDITYDELDYGNIETRRVLWTLLDEVKKRYGTKIDLSGKLLIEVCKEPDNEYRICFTSLPPRNGNVPSVKQLIRTASYPAAVECPSIDSIVNAAAAIRFDGKSSLYTDGRNYRLLIYITADMKPLLYAVLCEYGRILNNTDGLISAESEEYWQLIESSKAIEKLKMLV